MVKFDNSFCLLPDYTFERVYPTPIKNPRLIHVTDLKSTLGLCDLDDDELKLWLNGEKNLAGEQRISTRYAGHQFGVWAGQLGDGRAISIGEFLTAQGRLEVQTKGSGLTPFSRMGDGKAVIRSSVREYLCAEAMHGLGIPTTRSLALIIGDDLVQRETLERSALVARVFPSNLRFGHFEMYYHFKRPKELEALIEYTLKYFYPGLSLEEMLSEITQRTAKLMAQWMSVGFNHGVMNTDNMSVLGLTIDYGPFGFMEDFSLNHICNHSDHQGRYAFGQQPRVGIWNLERFLICFVDKVSREKLQLILNSYYTHFHEEFLRLGKLKLGLLTDAEGDFELFSGLFEVMEKLSLDFTFTFRSLCHFQKTNREGLKEFWDYYGQRAEFIDWLDRYAKRLELEEASDEHRSSVMKKSNPKYVLKNYIAQEIIESVEQDRFEKIRDWITVLYDPFSEHPEFNSYAQPTPAEHKHYVVSCSS